MAWYTRKLGEITTLVKGKKPTKFVKISNKPYLTAKVVRGTEIPQYVAESCPTSVWVDHSDIVIIMDGSNSGEMFTGLKGALASTMGIIRYQKDLIDPKFLLNFLISHRENFTKSRTGAAIPHLNKEGFENLEIAIPPLVEQKQIVKKLDEVFKKIAKVKENAERNLRNSKELFESYLNNVFANPDMKWIKMQLPLVELCELIVDCEHKTAPKQNEGIPSIRTPNIGKGILLLDGVYRVSLKTYEQWTQRAKPLGGDLILAREAPAGNVAVIPENLPLCLGQRTVLIRPKKEIFDSKFLAMFLLQPKMQAKLLAHSRGATVQHVNMKDIRALNIEMIPLLTEQNEIVKKLDFLSAETKKLEKIYVQKLADLDELKKSVLQKAFAGEL